MTNISIENNKSAIDYIDKAINKYTLASSEMKNGNDNPIATTIINSIEAEIVHLNTLKKTINGLNTNIDQALKEKATKEEEARIAEERRKTLEAERIRAEEEKTAAAIKSESDAKPSKNVKMVN